MCSYVFGNVSTVCVLGVYCTVLCSAMSYVQTLDMDCLCIATCLAMYLLSVFWVCSVLCSAMSYTLKSAHTGREWLKKTLRNPTCVGLAECLLVHHELVAMTLLYIEGVEHNNDHSPHTAGWVLVLVMSTRHQDTL